MTRKKKITLSISGAFVSILGLFFIFAPAQLEKSRNRLLEYDPVKVSASVQSLHDSLQIMDWHSDSLLWNRDFLARSDYGHVDAPRLRAGGINIQMLTTVTKSPAGLNLEENDAEGSDNLTPLIVVQRWPSRTWGSILERALYQSEKLADIVKRSKGSAVWIRSKKDLSQLLAAQAAMPDAPLGLLLGAEGAHPLEGDIANVDRLYKAGFRMIGLTHFFDNKLAGSLHGVKKGGLTEFGRAAVTRFDDLGIIIDLAHASEKAAWEVLALSTRPTVVSHTGLQGNCDSPRNFSDDLMKAIAAKGGLIAVGMWKEAICDPTPQGIAKALKYGIELVGADHIALGSDWDGTTISIPADALPQITQSLLNLGVTAADIKKIMGQNSVQFLQNWLPDE